MKTRSWMFAVALVMVMAGFARSQERRFLLLASTIGPIDAGIVDVLETAFEKETGIRVRHVGAGTGATIDIAKKGNVDLVMVHAKSLEEEFVSEGFGTERVDLMYNDFVILGPANDPAGVKGMKKATDALSAIAAKGALFVTRGDKSGTHVAEMELWKKAGIQPSGAWYVTYEKGSAGNGPTLRYSDERGAYLVMDRATFLTLKDQIKLGILVEKDEALLNYITLIPINPRKITRTNYEDAMAFVKWLTSPEKGQKIIGGFGLDRYGSPLFFPNSTEWKKSQGMAK
jgi:tungstate transport system substrate-binding protein